MKKKKIQDALLNVLKIMHVRIVILMVQNPEMSKSIAPRKIHVNKVELYVTQILLVRLIVIMKLHVMMHVLMVFLLEMMIQIILL